MPENQTRQCGRLTCLFAARILNRLSKPAEAFRLLRRHRSKNIHMKFPRSLLCLFLLLSEVLSAQTGRPDRVLRGIVQDQSGAVIPAALVVLRSSTGIEIGRTTTDERGAFSFFDTPATNSQLEISKAGFRTMMDAVKSGSGGRQPLHVV